MNNSLVFVMNYNDNEIIVMGIGFMKRSVEGIDSRKLKKYLY